MTLAIALAGVIIAAISLGWQITSWVLSAGRVRLTLKHGVLQRGVALVTDVDARGRVPSPRSPSSEWMQSGVEGDGDGEVLAVQVANTGRGPVTVMQYGFKFGRRLAGEPAFPVVDTIGPRLPHRLGAGESALWFMPLADKRAMVRDIWGPAPGGVDRHPHKVAMFVELGTGRRRRTRRAFVIERESTTGE